MKNAFLPAIVFVMSLAPFPAVAQTLHPLGVFGGMADIAADGAGNLHLIWVDGATLKYGRVVNNAVTQQETVASGVTTVFCRPRISVKRDGSGVHTTWVGPQALNSDNIFHAWRDAGGWHTETVWGTSNYKYFFPTCAVDGGGNVHLVASKAAPNTAGQLFYARKQAGGAWSAETALTDAAKDYVDVFMANDAAGGVHARWGAYDKSLRYRYAASGALLSDSATESIDAAQGTGSMGMGDLFVDGTGKVHFAIAAWDGNVNVDYAFKSGGIISMPTRVSGPIAGQFEVTPSMGFGPDGKAYVLWSEGAGDLIRLGVHGQSGWTVATVDDKAGMTDNFIKPAIAVTAAAVYGLWRAATHEWMLADLADVSPVDAGYEDTGTADSGANDAGAGVDGGTPDAGGPADTGTVLDTGTPQDAGTTGDTGIALDTGTPYDAGAQADAQAPGDAGKHDSVEPFEYDTLGCGCSTLGI